MTTSARYSQWYSTGLYVLRIPNSGLTRLKGLLIEKKIVLDTVYLIRVREAIYPKYETFTQWSSTRYSKQ